MMVSDIHGVDGHQVTHFRGRPIVEVLAGDLLLQVNLVNEQEEKVLVLMVVPED
jgi:hypothetical protein